MTLGLQSVCLSILLTEKAFIFCYHLDSKCALLRELSFDLCSFCLRMNIRQTCNICTRDLLSALQIGWESWLGCLVCVMCLWYVYINAYIWVYSLYLAEAGEDRTSIWSKAIPNVIILDLWLLVLMWTPSPTIWRELRTMCSFMAVARSSSRGERICCGSFDAWRLLHGSRPSVNLISCRPWTRCCLFDQSLAQTSCVVQWSLIFGLFCWWAGDCYSCVAQAWWGKLGWVPLHSHRLDLANWSWSMPKTPACRPFFFFPFRKSKHPAKPQHNL